MTIYDISEKAGVSIATVSRVLNGSSRVSEKTRQKVLAVMRQAGYTPNVFARGLGLNTMKIIGILCADSSDLYLAKAIYYVEKELKARGYGSILNCTGYAREQKAAAMEMLLSKKVDGILLLGSNFVYEKEEANRYILEASAQVPVLVLNAALQAPNVYSVLTDDLRSMQEATRFLLEKGIRDILYFYNSESFSGRRKLEGFRKAMKEAGVPDGEMRLQFYRGSHEDIHAMIGKLREVYEGGFDFRGLIAADDVLALAAVKYARERGLRVPEDLAVIGYNNSMLVNCCEPELSSIDNHLESMCQHLVVTLMGVLDGRQMSREVYFSGELVKRGTTP